MYALAVHGGAGPLGRAEREAPHQAALRAGLAAALQAGEHVLAAGGAALDAVQAAVVALEDDGLFNAAHGAVLTALGTAELDAAIMDGATLRAGAVALVQRARNPVLLARCVLERLPHVFLAGQAADRFAAESGLTLVDNEYFVTEQRRAQLRERRAEALPPQPAAADDGGVGGTVGAVARDQRGHLAAATSTGGAVGKRPGRIGDSPIIGAGTYADDGTCAVSTTGHGEWFVRTVQAYDLVARLRYGGQSLEEAVEQALSRLSRLNARGGLIAVDAAGNIRMAHNSDSMLRAAVRESEAPSVEIF
jgi:beta-aspartyl-peptidase (threonine type)